ncbi:MAG: RNA polymerase sigma factor [Planctomycetota bacterium]
MTHTRHTLILRVRQGDGDAWNQLDEIYRPMIAAWPTRFSLQSHDAQDISQNVMLVVTKKIDQFEHNGRPGSSQSRLRTITVYQARNFFRSQDRGNQVAQNDEVMAMLQDLEDPNSEISKQFDRQHDRHLIRCLLSSIEPGFEPVTVQSFRMQTVQGHSPEETAQGLGVSRSADHMHKSRVLKRLRE